MLRAGLCLVRQHAAPSCARALARPAALDMPRAVSRSMTSSPDAAAAAAAPARKKRSVVPSATLKDAEEAKLEEVSIALSQADIEAGTDPLTAVENRFRAKKINSIDDYTVVIDTCLGVKRFDRVAQYLALLETSKFQAATLPIVSKMIRYILDHPGMQKSQSDRIIQTLRGAGYAESRKLLLDQMSEIESVWDKERFVELLGSIGVPCEMRTIVHLIQASANERDYPRAQHYFDQISGRALVADQASWAGLIEAAVKDFRFPKAVGIGKRMREAKVTPSPAMQHSLIWATIEADLLPQLPMLLDELARLRAVDPSRPTVAAFNKCLWATARAGDMNTFRQIWELMTKSKIAPNAATAKKVMMAFKDEPRYASAVQELASHVRLTADDAALAAAQAQAKPQPTTQSNAAQAKPDARPANAKGADGKGSAAAPQQWPFASDPGNVARFRVLDAAELSELNKFMRVLLA
eukprot:TRINITY_DN99_c0_g1_i1.p1 TRINITY_DN99_c0_g1~~TRINITY_DN99_c0_g1_i1.p1  ORF type:complete len:467 (-),score=213.83 TRINITY_DN99_c0_g1_i1:444-1844(-)